MGLGLNVMGMAAGYKGYKDEQKRQADEERQRLADEATKADREYEGQKRSRQRYDWSEADRVRDDAKRSVAEYWEQHPAKAESAPPPAAPPVVQPPPVAAAPAADGGMQDGEVTTYPVPDPAAGITDAPLKGTSTPAVPLDASLDGAPQQRAIAPDMSMPGTPAAPGAPTAAPSAPPVASQPSAAAALGAPPAGIPAKPRALGNVLDMQRYVLEAAARKGDVSPQAYAQTRALLDKMRTEGVTQALEAFARGDYQAGIDAYNSMGANSGTRLIAAEETTTVLPDGRTMPTRKVTIANADGSRAVIDTTLDRWKAMGLEKQLEQMDKGAEREYKAGTLKVQQQNAETTAGYRKDQAENMREQRRLQQLQILAKSANASAAEAANWTDKADAYLVDANKSKDAEGNEIHDGEGLTFAKTVGIDYAIKHGGDAMSGAGYATSVNNRIRSAAAASLVKNPQLNLQAEISRLRNEYLKHVTRAAPAQGAAPRAAGSGSYFTGITPAEQSVIQAVADQSGVPPEDMAAVLRLEASGANATSPVGAKGRWQIMPANVQAYGGGDPSDFNVGAQMASNVLADAMARYPNDPRARIAYYNGGHAAGDAVAAGRQPPAEETRKYLARYDAMAGQPAPAAPPQAPTKAAAPAVAAAPKAQPKQPAMQTDEQMVEGWIDAKLMGMFDGPNKYLELSRTHPNPAVREAAANLYARAKAQAEASDAGSAASMPL